MGESPNISSEAELFTSSMVRKRWRKAADQSYESSAVADQEGCQNLISV